VVDPALPNPLYVEMATSLGLITVQLWPDVAPCTVNNFLAYMESGRYDGVLIHRTADDFVIQGGGYAYDSVSDIFSSIPRDPAVVNEPGESNTRATIAMARIGGQVNSATSEFFINLSDNSFLDTVDEGFTVFGVVGQESMAVVDAIVMRPRVVGNWALNSALRETFDELPVLSEPADLPGGYGCFDPFALPQTGSSGWLRALVNLDGNALEPDPLTGGIYYLSDQCDGSGATAPPTIPCTTTREIAFWSGAWLFDTPMSCERIAESDESLAARRDHLHPQVTAELVEITDVYLPEPTQTLLLLWGAAGLGGLARFRRPRRSRQRESSAPLRSRCSTPA
jgi:cyclophilin family peptidyl-prolyl cis-trans isomerase